MKSAPKVSAASFPDGDAYLLWNPFVGAKRWRAAQIRAVVSPDVVCCGLATAVAMVSSLLWAQGLTAVVLISLGVLGLGVGVLTARGQAKRFVVDHCHVCRRKCFLERKPGKFFFRSADFRACGPVVVGVVEALIESVRDLQRSPVQEWLDPRTPVQAHFLTWQALCCLQQAMCVRTFGLEFSEVNDQLRQLLAHLRSCVTLTRAWENKLRQVQVVNLRQKDIVPLRQEAEALLQDTFAHVTAARDVTGAGPFPWEREVQ